MNPLYLLLLLGVALPAGQAQPREDEPRDRREHGPRVIVYQQANYRGDSLVLYPGDSPADLSDLRFGDGDRVNDAISSIRIERGAEIYVYEHAGFRGHAMHLTESVRDLTTRLLPGSVTASWNDRISSLRVERTEEPRRGAPPRPDPEAIIKRAYQDLLLRDPDPTGLRTYRELILDQGWTEPMVRDHIRQGDEFKREGADRIIRRAYLEVLGREPDAGGLKQYHRALLEKDWTEDDVRADLKRSEEYRRKAGRR
jgi:hypothetical protein